MWPDNSTDAVDELGFILPLDLSFYRSAWVPTKGHNVGSHFQLEVSYEACQRVPPNYLQKYEAES